MMRPIERLQDRLYRDISWRKRELSAFRVVLQHSSDSHGLVCRAGWVIACAHWEGFLKCSLQEYVDFVFRVGGRIKDLSEVFVAVAYYQDVMKAAQAISPGSPSNHIALAARILEGVDVLCRNSGWEVRTDSNPSSSTTQSLLSSVGLHPRLGMDEAKWAATRVFLDDQLVRVRNQIAHGEGRPVDTAEFLEAVDRVVGLCEKLIHSVMGAAESESYLRSVN